MDIVERLRQGVGNGSETEVTEAELAMDRGADEIDRLRLSLKDALYVMKGLKVSPTGKEVRLRAVTNIELALKLSLIKWRSNWHSSSGTELPHIKDS